MVCQMGKISYKFNDMLSNIGLNLGSGRAKSINTRYSANPLTDAEIINAYRYAWLPRKVVDVPAEDATREWRQWDNDKVAKLEEKLRVKQAAFKAFQSARLFGHAGIYISTNRRNVAAPMADGEMMESLTVIDHDHLSVGEWNDDPTSPEFGTPKYYNVGDQQVHPSRIVLFAGNEVPADRNCLGDSVLQSTYDALKNADSVAANVAELVFEAKIDVVKVPGLMQNVGDTEYVEALNKRIALMMQFKSINNALLMDSEEEWNQKQIVFGSLNDLLMTAYQITAGAANIPMTRLLGRSASGLNSSGNNEIRDYYDTIRGIQTMRIEPAMLHLDEQLCRNAGVPDADYEWRTLWQPDEQVKAMANQNNAIAIGNIAKTDLFTAESLAEASAKALRWKGLVTNPDPKPDVNKSTDPAIQDPQAQTVPNQEK